MFFTDDKSQRPNLKTNSVVSINLKNAIIYEFVVVAKVMQKNVRKKIEKGKFHTTIMVQKFITLIKLFNIQHIVSLLISHGL